MADDEGFNRKTCISTCVAENGTQKQLHLVVVPYPGQGHINPMVQLAFRLASVELAAKPSFRVRVTFACAKTYLDPILRNWEASGAAPKGLEHSIAFEAIPDDVLPERKMDAIGAFIEGCRKLKDPFVDILRERIVPRHGLSCIVSDSLLGWAKDVAADFGVPWVCYFPLSASNFIATNAFSDLLAQGKLSLNVDDAVVAPDNDNAQLFRIPGLPPLSSSDLPNLYLSMVSAEALHKFRQASWIIFNTVDVLEFREMQALREQMGYRNVVGIGPLQPAQIIEHEQELPSSDKERRNAATAMPTSSSNGTSMQEIRLSTPQTTMSPNNTSMKPDMSKATACVTTTSDAENARMAMQPSLTTGSMWHQEASCLSWMDKAQSPVLYVSFGSIANVDMESLNKLLLALLESEESFLWVIRKDLVPGMQDDDWDQFSKLAVSTGRGLIVKWAPQLEVLRHHSIGAFLTHCGWNSTLESICAGVPMLAWPRFADQPLNAKYIVDVWKVGLRISTEKDMVSVMKEILRNDIYKRIAVELGYKCRAAVKQSQSNLISILECLPTVYYGKSFKES